MIIFCIVGIGDTNNTNDAIGASFDATSTKVGPIIILGDAIAGEDVVVVVVVVATAVAIPAIVDAMTFSVSIVV